MAYYNKPHTLEQMEAALRKHRGNIYHAAKALGLTRKTLYIRVERHPRLKELLAECRETCIDEAESALMRAVNDGEPWAVALLLKTIGKHRGYVEKQQVEHQGDFSVRVVEELTDAGDDEANKAPPGPDGVPPVE